MGVDFSDRVRPPCVRGGYMHAFLAATERLPPTDRDAFNVLVGADLLEQVRRSNSLWSWLPVEVNLTATRAIAQVLRVRRTHEFFVYLQGETFNTAIFSWLRHYFPAFVAKPSRLLKWVARGYSVMFKNAGTWRVTDVDSGSANLVLVDLPTVMVSDRIWLDSVASALQSVLEVSKLSGAVTISSVNAPRGTATYRCRWSALEGVSDSHHDPG